jgi:hypothetical protein
VSQEELKHICNLFSNTVLVTGESICISQLCITTIKYPRQPTLYKEKAYLAHGFGGRLKVQKSIAQAQQPNPWLHNLMVCLPVVGENTCQSKQGIAYRPRVKERVSSNSSF